MIRINLVAIFWITLFAAAAIFGWPLWIVLAQLALDHPFGRGVAVGFIGGLFVPLSIGWNMALRFRREAAKDRADQEYDRDRRSLWRR